MKPAPPPPPAGPTPATVKPAPPPPPASPDAGHGQACTAATTAASRGSGAGYGRACTAATAARRPPGSGASHGQACTAATAAASRDSGASHGQACTAAATAAASSGSGGGQAGMPARRGRLAEVRRTSDVQIGLVAAMSPFMAVCHEYRRSIRRYATVREMKEGPSRSAIRC